MSERRMLANRGWPFDGDRAREDHGFFGPDSPTWRVWTSPTALLGFQRSIAVEAFDPFLTAAVSDTQGIYTDPMGRLDSTLTYFTIVAIGDSRAAIESSEVLQKVHARATGSEPISGRRYSANDPDSQLWIHLTGWHSVLKCYEKYGPGPLSPADEDRYWADCVIAAELQTCDPATVPTSRDGVRQYFAEQRPRLCWSENADRVARQILYPPYDTTNRLVALAARRLSPAVIATLPRWMRCLSGLDQSRVTDAAIVPAMKAAMASTRPLPIRLRLADIVAPSIRPVWENALRGRPPLRDEIVTPSEARQRYGSAAIRDIARAKRNAAHTGPAQTGS
ncbi:oxygenase MpaB family protein [Haloechinothrix halophila]|uniref:oxygenase MpaB family protein n=1 Tax=Haloechinothrix halophila TaxID=1069073 RepID=UPI00040E0F7A|nr:oxygenase MpaB family protein [Haloechinothrix halophila]